MSTEFVAFSRALVQKLKDGGIEDDGGQEEPLNTVLLTHRRGKTIFLRTTSTTNSVSHLHCITLEEPLSSASAFGSGRVSGRAKALT